MTRAPSDRSHLSIGEVLSLLQGEFPDVTISKIRFLESQGLLDPERTPSGYRKFYETDIDRLRWILRQQKDHYLPLKVIKDRLDDAVPHAGSMASRWAHNGMTVGAPGADESGSGSDRSVATAVALDERPDVASPAGDSPARTAPTARPAGPAGTDADPAVPPRAERPVGAPGNRQPTPATASEPAAPGTHGSRGSASPAAPGTHGSRGSASPAAPGTHGSRGSASPAAAAGSVSLTAEELAQQSGLAMRDLRDLERYGLIESSAVGDSAYYDADALVIAQTAAGFLQHGIEARHMRSYKVAVDREAGLFEQIVLPLLKQRNPEARQRARDTITELVQLGQQMRGVLLSRELRNVAGPS